jgi:nucleoside-diphosphate-sugar epimerase
MDLSFISASCQSALSVEENGGWDYVINCACETKSGQTDPVYREGILKLSLNCASEAAKLNVKRFVEVSSGHMCSSNKVGLLYVLLFNQCFYPHFHMEKFQSCTKLILPAGKY